MEVTGTIKRILPVQNVSATFRKRELVVSTDEQYPQTIAIEFTQDKVDLLDRVREGEAVSVSINIRGREWTSPQGDVRYFVSLQGWRVQAGQAGAPASAPSAASAATAMAAAPVPPAPAASGFAPVPDDDLPF
jgi:hypothetical protein